MKTKLLIFGITGDLSTRKLLPALKNIIDSRGLKMDKLTSHMFILFSCVVLE